ncbi:Ger(x)C family spore germination protein [Neobacillus sp. 114]|uniref:Ger(x)C family spore germination protein n=1 Tax=Neobacillus sp. 114 TaxID=3048535 RepID=UPI001C215F3B|nr:Ger(x)C family spore germination protein [Neobacillus sp. 114]MBU8916573.1 Ger(x)C family spore germination protein [Bacillus sp. FJAT-29953]
MQKTKTVCKFLLIVVIVFSLTGCWDREEMEDRSYVIGLGLDRSHHKGKIKVTMLLANPEVGSQQGGGGSTEKPREIVSFDANDIIAAKVTANSVVSRIISYDLLKIIVVSEEFAKDPKFYNIINDVVFDKEIRMNAYLAVSKEKAAEYFLKNKPKMETRPHKYFQYMIDHGIENGLIPDSTLFRFFKTTDRGADLFLAMNTSAVREKHPKFKGEDEYFAGQLNASGEFDDTQFIGSAVFRNGVMIGKLTGQETSMVNILDDTTNMSDFFLDIPNPFPGKRKSFAVRVIKKENNQVKMDLKGSRPKIFISIPLKFEIMSNPSRIDFAKRKNQEVLKKQIASHFKTELEKFLKKTQKELKGAPYPLSFYARKYFGTNQEFEKFNWTKSYLKAEISVYPEVEIIDFGKSPKKNLKVEK